MLPADGEPPAGRRGGECVRCATCWRLPWRGGACHRPLRNARGAFRSPPCMSPKAGRIVGQGGADTAWNEARSLSSDQRARNDPPMPPFRPSLILRPRRAMAACAPRHGTRPGGPSARCFSSLGSRAVVLAAVVALIASGVRLPAADFIGVSVRHTDEPVSGAPRHGAPAGDAEELEEAEKERETTGSDACCMVARGGPSLEMEAGGFLHAAARAPGSCRMPRGVLTIRGPPRAC